MSGPERSEAEGRAPSALSAWDDDAPPRRPRRRGRWLLALVALALVAGGVWWRMQGAETSAPQVASVAVYRGDIEQTVLASGVIKPSRLVAVGSQATGRILSLKVGLGDEVKEGDLIAEIDSVTQENALAKARAALANVRAQRAEKEATLTQAQANLARQKRMIAQRAVSQADLETAEADVAVAEAQIAALDAQIAEAVIAVSTAEAELAYTRIDAPIDGTVLAVVAQQGATLNAAQSAPTVAILGQLDVMTVRAEISEADIVDVAPGQPVWFTILGDPGRRYEAVLQAIEPAPESIVDDPALGGASAASSSGASAAVYYIGLFDAPNPDGRLRTYMTAEAHIVLGSAEDALLVPVSALGPVQPDGSRSVQVLRPDGGLETRKVTVGLNDRIEAEILSGLEEGERVVVGQSAAALAAGGRRGRSSPMGL